jgi:hypothetical protein
MAKFIPVEPEKWAEMVKALAEVERLRHLANQSEFYRTQLQKDTCRLENIQMQDAFKHYEAENARLKAENERLRKACKLVFDESAKRKFLMCYRGNDFYVSLEAMEAMSEALGYRAAKDGTSDR